MNVAQRTRSHQPALESADGSPRASESVPTAAPPCPVLLGGGNELSLTGGAAAMGVAWGPAHMATRPSPSQLRAAPAGDTPQPASLPLPVALRLQTLQDLSHPQQQRRRALMEGRGQAVPLRPRPVGAVPLAFAPSVCFFFSFLT